MSFLRKNWYRLVVILIMLGAFADNQYSYYQFLRWVTAISSFYLAYVAYNKREIAWVWTFTIIGILFNPVAPFYLGREMWAIFNLVVAGIYFVSIFKFKHYNARSN